MNSKQQSQDTKEEKVTDNMELTSSQCHLSSYDYEEKNDQDDTKEQKYERPQDQEGCCRIKTLNLICFSIYSIIQFALLSFLAIIILTFEFFKVLKGCTSFSYKKNLQMIAMFFSLIIAATSISYILMNIFILEIHNEQVRTLYQEGGLFIFSTLLVLCYIKVQYKNDSSNGISSSFSQYFVTEEDHHFRCQDYDMEYIDNSFSNHFRFKGEEYVEYHPMEAMVCDFVSHKSQSSKYTLLRVFNSFQVKDNQSRFQQITLVIITILKLIGVYFFVYIHSFQHNNLNFVDTVDMIVIIFGYIYISLTLLRTLGSYDLKRKEQQMKDFIYMIDFRQISKKNDNLKKLDITDPCTLEEFDNTRKLMLNQQLYHIQRLDYAYLGLVFYYLAVIIVCFSYYFDLEWLIPIGSSFRNPVYVILSTGSFFFLSAFLMFRFNHGTNFNNTFHDLEITIDHLLDIFEDLISLYDHFFIQPKKILKRIFLRKYENSSLQFVQTISPIDKSSVYALLIKKIKVKSKGLIKNQIKYEGRIYTKDEKAILRKEMLRKIKESVERIKKSVQTDSKIHKYKFMNFIQIDLSSFVFTIILGFATTLPNIIPKFIQFYQK